MKKLSFFIVMLLLNSSILFSQIGINTDGSAPDASAGLDVNYTNKGFLPPRMTHAGLNTISNPANGLLVFCTDCGSDSLGSIAMFMAGSWYILNASCLNPTEPGPGTHEPSPEQIIWNWDIVPYATGYKWNTENVYGDAEDIGTGTTKTETSLICNTPYTRYVWAYNDCGGSSATTLNQTTSLDPPDAPTAGTHVSSHAQIKWNWNIVTDATGYKWNTTNNYESAEDMGSDTTKTETGLTYGTSYTRYVWSYNNCGVSTPNSLTQTTLSFTCGDSITINHIAGSVAPVTKTVTYGTVDSIPGETSKCWITSNLGADHQATAVNDATEASAGWYWQYNRMQGYKHDGTTRTPNTSWEYPISENIAWEPENEPCVLELGNEWRLPTYTEWYNVDAVGGWYNWNGPWNSALKLHAAGFLNYPDGSSGYRGQCGYPWSITQINSGYGWLLFFCNNCSYMNSNGVKSHGFTVRCLKDAQMPTITTAGATDITPNTATSGGNVISDGGLSVTARGVCWSTSSNPTTADSHTTDGSGTGEFVSNLTGLTDSTIYYVRAYATNSIGTAYGNEESFITLYFWSCGDSITINHVAGSVAPVDKTVTYGTVTNIPGESSKCWITSNLGADHQADSVHDATEASAGWYWQFNRLQGYKQDGTTVTPAWTITYIYEYLDWEAANDPCAPELGTGWRIPTYTEWANVDAIGGWTHYDDPWNSALKMHAAGYLNTEDGSVAYRGGYGYYWSSTKNSSYDSWLLEFYNGDTFMIAFERAHGFSLRCLKE